MGQISVGITERDGAVQMVWIRGGFNRFEMLEAVTLEVPEDRDAWDFAAEQVARTTRDRKFGKVNCVVGLNAAGAFVRIVEFPFTSPHKIAKVLPLELEASLPLSLEQIRHDCRILPSPDKKSRRVLVAAVLSADAQQVADAFDGIRVASLNADLDVSGLSALGILLKADMPDQFLMLRVFRGRVDYVCIGQGKCILHRSSVMELEDTASTGQEENTSDLDVLRTKQGKVAHRIGRSLRLATGEAPDFTPTQIVLCGELSDNSVFQSALELDLDIPVQSIADALQNSRSGARIANLQDGLYPALGLALQPQQYGTGYDLLDTAQGRDVFSLLKANAAALAILLLVVFGGWAGSEWYKIALLKEKRANVALGIERVARKVVPETRKLNNAQYVSLVKAALKKARQEHAFQDHAAVHMPMSEALLAVSSSVRSCGNAVVSSLTVDPKSLKLTGRSGSFRTVQNLADALEAAGLGRVGIKRAKAVGGDKGVDFDLDIERGEF